MGKRTQIPEMRGIHGIVVDRIRPSKRDRLIVQNVGGGKTRAIACYGIGCPCRRGLIIRPFEGVTAKYLVCLVECMVDTNVQGPRIVRNRSDIRIIVRAGERVNRCNIGRRIKGHQFRSDRVPTALADHVSGDTA